jgi:ABC-2 type transport system permease protein
MTLRALIGRRRSLLLVPLPVLLIALTAFAGFTGGDADGWAEPVLVGFGLTTMLPLVALVVGTGVLSSEIDDGTLLHVLAKPLPRREIVLTKLAVAAAVTVAVTASTMFCCGAIADGALLGAGFAVGAAVAGSAYTALFVALSLVVRRPVLVGLLYVLIWEGVLVNLVSGTGVLSVQRYAVALSVAVSDTDLVTSSVALPTALVMSALCVVGGAMLATARLKSFTAAGETG